MAGRRQTTRVFEVVEGNDSPCMLRSGRRLWPDSNEGDERVATKQEVSMVQDDNINARSMSKVNDEIDRFFGIKYSRKRKRTAVDTHANGATHGNEVLGSQFFRKKERSVLVVEPLSPSCEDNDLFSCFLFRVLRHTRGLRLTLKELQTFILSDPICADHASRGGIQLLQGSATDNGGTCQFFGIEQCMPLFSVDFTAVPICFKFLHSQILLRSSIRSFFLVHNPVNVHSDVEEEIGFLDFQIELQISCNSSSKEASENGTITPKVMEINDDSSLHASTSGSRLAGQNGPCQNMNSDCRPPSRRVSQRKRKPRIPFTIDETNGASASNSKQGRKKKSIKAVGSNKKQRSLANGCTSVNRSEAKSARADSTERLNSSFCSVNILTAESDRVEGAVVTIEQMTASKEWLLVVKKDGLTRCSFKAEKVMKYKYCSTNRFTRLRMFSLENGWKLEFANKKDWIAFKNLYKECSDSKITALVVKDIPVPVVRDVPDYEDSYTVPFHRPHHYISENGDELSRALARKTANYDMDSQDEAWLMKFNDEFQQHVSEDQFELIIDALEKAHYYNPDKCFDEKYVAQWCQDFVTKEVAEAVYKYWMKKRKRRRSSLLRVFKMNRSKKGPRIPPERFLRRKRRSFRRQPSQLGGGKHPSGWQAFPSKQDASEEKNEAMLKIEAAKASANEWTEFAKRKRKRAESLMEVADLATYKATKLVRIAETAQARGSVDAFARHFLG